MHFRLEIKWTQGCTWKQFLWGLRRTLLGYAWANLVVHLEAEINGARRCTLVPWLNKSCVAFGGHEQARLEMHVDAILTQRWRPYVKESGDWLPGNGHVNLETMIEQVWWNTWRQWLCGLSDALLHSDQVTLEVYLEVVDLEVFDLNLVDVELVNMALRVMTDDRCETG